MNTEFWNKRYASGEYAYGIEPNELLKSILPNLTPGKILFPAEGEGRNAVYAATLGWEVYAFDNSETGKHKAEALAVSKGVNINYSVAGFETYDPGTLLFDAIVMVFTHLPEEIRKHCYRRLLHFLKPGGEIIVIGFSKKQLGKSSGGPQDSTMLYDEKQLRDDFHGLNNIHCEAIETILDEGPFHSGQASLIYLRAQR